MAVAIRSNHQSYAGDEQELVAAVRAGDNRAFELLYARYRPRIGAYVQNMVGDHGRAEDIAQDVFISALRRLRATDRPVMFKPWLYEIAKNACIDEFRRTRRAQEVPLDPEFELDELGNLHSLMLTPDAAIESKQRLDDLRGAFRGLSDSQHRILVLRELEGLSYTQIGDRLGISKPVVESTLFRARRRLGEEFAELESGRRCARVQGVIAAVADGARPSSSFGLRERRLMTRHLSHCAPCQLHARRAGVDAFNPRETSKIRRAGAAIILPLPWWRLRSRSSSGDSAASGGAHAATAMQAVQAVVPAASSGTPLSDVARAATAAVLAIAGVGGGFVASRSINNVTTGTPVSHHLRVGVPGGGAGLGVLGPAGVAGGSGAAVAKLGRATSGGPAAGVGGGRIAIQQVITTLPQPPAGAAGAAAPGSLGQAASATAGAVVWTIGAAGGAAPGALGGIALSASAPPSRGNPVGSINVPISARPIVPVTSGSSAPPHLGLGRGGVSSSPASLPPLGTAGASLGAAANGSLNGAGRGLVSSVQGVVSGAVGGVQSAVGGTTGGSGASGGASGGTTNSNSSSSGSSSGGGIVGNAAQTAAGAASAAAGSAAAAAGQAAGAASNAVGGAASSAGQALSGAAGGAGNIASGAAAALSGAVSGATSPGSRG